MKIHIILRSDNLYNFSMISFASIEIFSEVSLQSKTLFGFIHIYMIKIYFTSLRLFADHFQEIQAWAFQEWQPYYLKNIHNLFIFQHNFLPICSSPI